MRIEPKQVRVGFQHPREAKPLPIINDAAIAARGFGEGRLVPVLVVDASERPDIVEILRVHEHIEAGDVNSVWASMPNEKESPTLLLDFIRPVQAKALIRFELPRQIGLVDAIVKARAIHLVAGEPGDRFIDRINDPRIIIEVAASGFDSLWEEMMLKRLFHEFREKGLKRPEAKRAAKEMVRQWRSFTGLRMTTDD